MVSQIKSSLLFADFIWGVIKSMAYDIRLFLIIGCFLIIILNIRTFFSEAPIWAKSLFSFYVFSRLLPTIKDFKPPTNIILKLKKDLWLSSLRGGKRA